MASESGIFEGTPGRLVFSHSTKLLEEGLYYDMGRLLAMSLTQGGPGLQCLSLAAYRFWTRQQVGDECLTIDLIADLEMQQKLQKVVMSW